VDALAVELARRRVFEVLDAGLADPQLRLAQVARQALVVAVEALGVDEQAQPLVEGKAPDLGIGLLLCRKRPF